MKNNAWKEILDNLRSLTEDRNLLETRLLSVESLQKYWRSTRDNYTREKKIVKGKSGVGLDEVQSDWPYYNSMLFLDQADIYRGGTSGASSFIKHQQDEDEDDFENDRSEHDDGEEEQG